MANKIQLRRDTAANWEAVNPVLGDGEPGFVIDTNQVKYGDGSTPWNNLGWGGTGLNPDSVAIGYEAGKTNQSNYSVAVGTVAGQVNQNQSAVAIGYATGQYNQGIYSVAIGQGAGNNNQGAYAIAIGEGAGYNYQTTGSIAISATGNGLDTGNAGLYIDPIRNDLTSTNLALFYDATTKEITYSTASQPNALINGTHSVTLLPNGALTGDGANGNFYIDTITSTGTTSTWVFDVSGALTFPDATIQTTAYTGGGGSNSVTPLDDYLYGVVAYDASTGTTWVQSYPNSNFTANFVNLPTTNNSIVECKLIINQGHYTGIPNILQVEGSPVAVKWNDGIPEGYSENTDEITIKLIRTNNTWTTVLGSLTTYGALPPRVNTIGPAGRFLVMGSNTFKTSIDGVSWSQCNSNGSQAGAQNATADTSTGRIWTAGDAGGYSESDKVYYTTDLFGSGWVESNTLPISARWNGIVAHSSNVVVWDISFPAVVYASTDTGVTWNLAITNTGTFYQPQMMWEDTTNQFIAVDNSISFTSTDGVSWIKNGDVGVAGFSGQIASGGGKLVAVGGGVAYSSDHGATWNNATNTNPWGDLRGVAYGNGRWVAAAYDSGLTYGITSSIDGITWTNQAVFTDDPLWDLEFGNGTFIVRGINGGTYVSTTGLEGSWTTATQVGSYGNHLIFVPDWN